MIKKLLTITILFSSLFLAGCVASKSGPRVSVTPVSYDFGDIIQSQGSVKTSFTVTNTGDALLEINRLSTSCGCTTAKMDESPLAPAENREMTVVFDPMVHPDQFGIIQRVVYLQTSDPEMPEVEINLTGNVIH